MNPEELEQAAAADPAAQTAPAPDGDGDAGQEDGTDPGDTGPISQMQIDPAEDGGAVVTHHPRVPERVKSMDHPSAKPRKHVVKDHKELVKHVEKHGKRLKP